MTKRYALRDDQWERIRDLLPGREGHVGGTAKDNRRFVEAVLYRYRAGIPWRDLPLRFGETRHMLTSGVWEKVFRQRRQRIRHEVDATILRNTLPGQKGGQAECLVGGFQTPCDVMLNPTSFHTPGQASDLAGADALLPDLVKHIGLARGNDAQERVLDVLERRR